MGDYSDIYEAMKEERRAERELRRDQFLTSIMPAVQDYAKKNSLIFRKLTDYQYRVQNRKGQFVDLWTTRAMRFVNGNTGGFGYAEKNLWREILKLHSL